MPQPQLTSLGLMFASLALAVLPHWKPHRFPGHAAYFSLVLAALLVLLAIALSNGKFRALTVSVGLVVGVLVTSLVSEQYRLNHLRQKEDILARLEQRIQPLETAMRNLQIPDTQSGELFSKDLVLEGQAIAESWQVWPDLFSEATYFEWADFHLVDGGWSDESAGVWSGKVQVKALGREKDSWLAVRAQLKLNFQMNLDPPQILSWKTESFETETQEQLLFEEFSEKLLEKKDREYINRSASDKSAREIITGERKPGTSPGLGLGDSPGICVTDLNSDSWPDFLLPNRNSNITVLLSRASGEYKLERDLNGLTLEKFETAIAADVDNDGDPDLFLGGKPRTGLFLLNEGDRFVDRTNFIQGEIPRGVRSFSAADVNRDGLLDIQISCYGGVSNDKRSILNKLGPSNLILYNLGESKFQMKDIEVDTQRNTFQSIWGDFDKDGWPDLFSSNDFAVNQIFLNIEGKVRQAAFDDDPNFSMGVASGDFDGDGWLDVYVSNMGSTAGRRLTKDGPDSALQAAAKGNVLLKNQRGKGFEAVEIGATNANWAWGGQFLDVDNDGWLDLYVPNGMYTPPDGYGKKLPDT